MLGVVFALTIITLLIPIFINLIATYPMNGHFKWLYPNQISQDAVWVPSLASIFGAVFGGIISGVLTLQGVRLSNKQLNRQQEDEFTYLKNQQEKEKTNRLLKVTVFFQFEINDNKTAVEKKLDVMNRMSNYTEKTREYPKYDDLKTGAFQQYFLDLIDIMDTDELHKFKETYDLINDFIENSWSSMPTNDYHRRSTSAHGSYIKEQTEELVNNLRELLKLLQDKEYDIRVRLAQNKAVQGTRF